MHVSAAASEWQKPPWGKTQVCGVCERMEIHISVRKLGCIYGEILHALRSVLVQTWNADTWFVDF